MIGEGFLFTLNGARLKAFSHMLDGLAQMAVGRNPVFVTKLWEDIWQEINPSGHKGVTISALSALDTACWDIIGKAADLPLHHIFGACRDQIDCYASSGLWLSYDIEALQRQAQDFVKQGFKGMKIRLGSQNLRDDVVRVNAVREVIGPNIDLYADINQGLSVKAAIRLGRSLEPFDLKWIEEPVAAYDLDGHAAVCAALDIDIASGETEYTRFGMQAMIASRACDVLMPDLQRIGGLTEMRRVAALAHSHNMPISTHFFTQYSLSVAGSAANCVSVEHIDWFDDVFNEDLEMRDGKISIPTRPGTGFTFRAGLFSD